MIKIELGKLYKIDNADKKAKYHCFADGSIVVTLKERGKAMKDLWECASLYGFVNESIRQTIHADDLAELTEEDYAGLSVLVNAGAM